MTRPPFLFPAPMPARVPARMPAWIPALAAALALAACMTDPPPPPALPVDEGPGVWRLVAVNGVPPAGPVTLAFDTGRQFVGLGPCNRYFGSYSGIAPAFRPGAIGATQMACDRLEEEGRYFAALTAVTRIERGPGRMVLTGPGVRLDYATPVN